ncbi:hypothetical protein GCM10023169_29990 [Georgenia halophila]|uniref:Uncharacterized protein n=1 Tax=Georgenia halophila TaxID=620889 RepID=A0ABP8LH08_9MICO
MTATAIAPTEEISRPSCESCVTAPATFRLVWADSTEFQVCAGCTPPQLITVAPATGTTVLIDREG